MESLSDATSDLCIGDDVAFCSCVTAKTTGYKQLIDRYKHVLNLNIYNLSCHFQRHVEQSDIDEVEQTKLRWEKMKQESDA